MKPLARLEWLAGLASRGDLPPAALRVAVSLSLYVNSSTGRAYPGIDNLASDTGLHRATVVRLLGRLEDAGYLAKSRGGGRGRATEWTLKTVAIEATESAPETVAPEGDSNGKETVAETVAFEHLNCRIYPPKLSQSFATPTLEPIEPIEPPLYPPLPKADAQSADAPPPRKRFKPPTVEEVSEYVRENGYDVDPQHWHDHYTSNGWRVGGRSPMKDWRAAVRTWNARRRGNRGVSNGSSRGWETPHERLRRINGDGAPARGDAPGAAPESHGATLDQDGRLLRRR